LYTNSADFESTRVVAMVGVEKPENVWNFESSRLAKSALLFFNLKEGLFTLSLQIRHAKPTQFALLYLL